MIPVNQADVNVRSKVIATMPCVGPFFRLPDRRSNHMRPGRTAKTRNRIHPTAQSNTYNAVIPDPLLTRATQSARRIQPATSLPTPAASTVTPTGVPSSFSSVRMRQRTGKAVIWDGH